MNGMNAGHHLGAMTMAIGVTFGIVWALSNYAYTAGTVTNLSQMARQRAESKACS